MNLRILLITTHLLLIVPLYAQEKPDYHQYPVDPVASWRSPALFLLGISASHIGIFGSTFKPFQTRPISIMRAAISFAKLGLGITLITCSDRIIEQIDEWKKANPLPHFQNEEDYLKQRRGI